MISISELKKSDISELAILATKTYTETFEHLIPAKDLEKTLEETRSEAYFSKCFKTDNFIVAKAESALIGYIQISNLKYEVSGFHTEEHDQSINAIYIQNDYQRQGIGKKLMNAALAHERLKDLNRVFIDVWEKNEKAVSFYLSYGFKEVGKCDFTVDGKIVGYDLVLMKDIK